jgi:hypothetical protein
MDWPSQYHAILEWPAFSWFMAVPHYTYLVLKMPGPKGIITVKGSFEVSDFCDMELIRLQRIHNFWCSMLVFAPFALYFVTLHGTFMRFSELTY